MIKKIATGALAVAATTALALSLPSAAQASAPASSGYDYQDGWSAFAKYDLAKAEGWVGVDWDHHQESNTVTVKGRLYDLDNRTYSQGGKCAYVKFQAADEDYDWSTVYTKKYCGYPGFKKFYFEEEDVYSLRAKVCQIGPNGGHVKKCGHWTYLYTVESE
ncbi:hypothetical protein HII36_30300 [Nonomuraea sp. NN258]|uniref:hypothetical protein n=1 Tax=Nonomuraea antri TaxID=2730852 RepID=UPI00156A7131|nr:hypothetical protein [Nonomuraea antri]NRQ36094.1 hypothetical protein [Nonomuraea antri]